MGAGQLVAGQERVPGLTWRPVACVDDVLAVLSGESSHHGSDEAALPSADLMAWCCMHPGLVPQQAPFVQSNDGASIPPAEGSKNRATAATSLNAHSSRSHALLSVRLTDAAGQSSVLHLVDLAGGWLWCCIVSQNQRIAALIR